MPGKPPRENPPGSGNYRIYTAKAPMDGTFYVKRRLLWFWWREITNSTRRMYFNSKDEAKLWIDRDIKLVNDADEYETYP